MSCEARRDDILLYAADLLEAEPREILRAHLASGCPRCTGALAEARALLATIPAGVEPVAPPPEAVKRLMKRAATPSIGPIRGDSAGSTGAAPPSAQRAAGKWSGVAVALAACIGLVLGGIALHLYERPAHLRSLHNALALADDRQAKLDALESMFKSRDLNVVALAPMDKVDRTRAPIGKVLWDRDRGEWHVYVFDLMPPQNGREYELWYITPEQKKIRAGMLATDNAGFGSMTVKLPESIGPIALAAITDEPPGGVDQPTGSIHLAGKVQAQ